MKNLGLEKQAVSIKISKFNKRIQSEPLQSPQWLASFWISLRLSSIFLHCPLTYVIPTHRPQIDSTSHQKSSQNTCTHRTNLIKCLKSPSKITLSLVLDTLISLKGKPSSEGEEVRRGEQRAHTVIHMSLESNFHQEYQVIFVP